MPDQVRHDDFETFHENITSEPVKNSHLLMGGAMRREK
jgi:hypothetical protein